MIGIKKRSTIIPAVYLFLEKDDKILLLRRYNTGYEDGNYSLVAGHVEKNETFMQSMIREAEEEAGIILREDNLEMVHVMNRKGERVKDDDRVDVYFLASKWKGKIENKELLKCDELSWFEINKLPKNIIPSVNQAIKNIKLKKYYSEFGWK